MCDKKAWSYLNDSNYNFIITRAFNNSAYYVLVNDSFSKKVHQLFMDNRLYCSHRVGDYIEESDQSYTGYKFRNISDALQTIKEASEIKDD